MNDEEQKKITKAFSLMQVADKSLEEAAKILAEFDMDVPNLNHEAVKLMGDTTNAVEQSNNFVRSFIRLSVLRQVVKPKETTSK